jgi:hypothetical protein
MRSNGVIEKLEFFSIEIKKISKAKIQKKNCWVLSRSLNPTTKRERTKNTQYREFGRPHARAPTKPVAFNRPSEKKNFCRELLIKNTNKEKFA